jgi:hypothetical protein
MGLAALALTALGQQQACAWHKCSLGIGLGLHSEGANNSCLFGMFKGGPPPNDYGYGHGQHGFDGPVFDPGMYGGLSAPAGADAYHYAPPPWGSSAPAAGPGNANYPSAAPNRLDLRPPPPAPEKLAPPASNPTPAKPLNFQPTGYYPAMGYYPYYPAYGYYPYSW